MIGAVREVVTGQPPVVPSPVFAAAAVRSGIGRLMSGSRDAGLIARWADSVTSSCGFGPEEPNAGELPLVAAFDPDLGKQQRLLPGLAVWPGDSLRPRAADDGAHATHLDGGVGQ